MNPIGQMIRIGRYFEDGLSFSMALKEKAVKETREVEGAWK